MSYVAITLETDHQRFDLALPLDVPSRLLVNGLVEKLKLPKKSGAVHCLHVHSETGLRPVPLNASLAEMVIVHGMVLALLTEQQKGAAVIATGASLKLENGPSFPLTTQVTVIGRNDPKSGVFVEIDLNGLAIDPKVISRRHARIEQDGDRFYLVDMRSTNGTRLNGKRIPADEKQPLWNGDQIELGRNGAIFIFTGGSKPG